MKLALIRSVRTRGIHTFGWKWRAADGARESADTFKYFHDCCENARRHGYECRFDGVAAGTGTPASLHRSVVRPEARRPGAP